MGGLLQELIAPPAAVEKIVHAEIADIHVQHGLPDRGIPLGRERKKKPGLLQEAGLPRKSRNAVDVMEHILSVAVQKEHVKYRPQSRHLDTVSELLHRLHLAGLCDNAVIDIVKHIGAGRNLLFNILFYLVDVIRMHQLLKRTAGGLQEILHVMTAENMNEPGIGEKDFLLFVRSIYKNAAGHAVHGMGQNGSIVRCLYRHKNSLMNMVNKNAGRPGFSRPAENGRKEKAYI